MKQSNNTKAINISLPAALIKQVDIAAHEEFATRSDFIRDSILRKLNSRERWETIIDFTTVEKGGVDVDELLKRL
ncbi:MAG TPA: ribbon-helix-helix domain-containing protein [Candidatus Saccharimonadales bacterium]|nr:ribbon-helix-helix domain-containing protein [Candidatus Saccharimonadales bacterium]